MNLQLFSDSLKRTKIASALLAIVTAGIYNYDDSLEKYVDYSSAISTKNASRSENGDICIQQARIERVGSRFFAVTRLDKFELLNPPKTIKGDQRGDFAIRGKIINSEYLAVDTIRQKNHRPTKIVSSMLTAIIILLLFFLFFRITKRGIVPKRVP